MKAKMEELNPNLAARGGWPHAIASYQSPPLKAKPCGCTKNHLCAVAHRLEKNARWHDPTRIRLKLHIERALAARLTA